MSAGRNGPPPLGPLALSLSGGGGRAAGFHLGTLAYLDRIGLLEDVTTLSTVSGGSFVGASYVLALKQAPAGEDLHVTFQRYFDRFRHTLWTTRLLPWALQNLATGKVRVPSGRETLVTALAQVYDDTFLDHARFGMLWEGHDIHVKEIIFNATEFRTGMAFRFQKSEYPCVIGNDQVSVATEYAKQIRLADIVAASSCIPVGLEPVMFPDDFRWPDDSPDPVPSIKSDLKRQCGESTVPIMDGGVYDNQGIESVILALRRSPRLARVTPAGGATMSGMIEWFRPLLASPDELGTFIVSDTPLMTPSQLAADVPPRRGVITLRRLDLATRALAAAALITIAYLIAHLLFSDNQLNVFSEIDDFFTYAIPIALAALLFAFLVMLRHRVNAVLNAFPQIGHRSWTNLRDLTLSQVVEMTKLRFASTWALTSWVYFNRIRQLGYAVLRALPGASRHVIPHEIGDLIYNDSLPNVPAWLKPSAAAAALAHKASSLPTQLWYDSEADLDAAIDCGRMTMCFNLLAHLERECAVRTPAQQDLYERAKADWLILQADPSASLPQMRAA